MRQCGFLVAVLALAACHSAPQAGQTDATIANAETEVAASNAGLPAQAPNTIRGAMTEADKQAGAGMTSSMRDCHFEVDGKRRIKDGPDNEFRCFSASQEAQYTNVYNARKHNFDTLRNVTDRVANSP